MQKELLDLKEFRMAESRLHISRNIFTLKY